MQGLVEAEGRYVRRLFVLLLVYQEPLALTKLCSKDTLKVRAAARRTAQHELHRCGLLHCLV